MGKDTVLLDKSKVDKMYYEYSHLGISILYHITLELKSSPLGRIPITDTWIGIMSDKLRIQEQTFLEIISIMASELHIIDSESLNENILKF